MPRNKSPQNHASVGANTERVPLRSLFLDESTKQRIVTCLVQNSQEVPLSSVPVLRALLMDEVVTLAVPLAEKPASSGREGRRRRRSAALEPNPTPASGGIIC